MPMSALAGLGTQSWNTAPRADRDPAKAARQFEAMLLEGVLTQLRTTVAGDAEADDPGSKTMGSIADHALSEALVARGGIGFSRMLQKALGDKIP